MSASRLLIRWSICGSSYILIVAALQMLTLVLEGRDAGAIFTSDAVQHAGGAEVLVFALSGIPLGFLIYQVYYGYYGRRYPFGIVNRDIYGNVLRGLPRASLQKIARRVGLSVAETEDLTVDMYYRTAGGLFLRLDKAHRTPDWRRRSKERHRNAYAIVQFLLIRKELLDRADVVRREYTTLSDIFHALGATRVAVLGAFATYIIYNVAIHDYLTFQWINVLTSPGIARAAWNWRQASSLGAATLIALALVAFVGGARGQTQVTIEKLLRFYFHQVGGL